MVRSSHPGTTCKSISTRTFAGLWLAEVLPAVALGTTPASVQDAGLFVNPVHVLDLSFVLPAMLVAGVSLWRRQSLGLVLGPIMLTFAGLMTAAICAMLVAMLQRGLPVQWWVAVLLGGLTLASPVRLGALLLKLRFPGGANVAHPGLGARKRAQR